MLLLLAILSLSDSARVYQVRVTQAESLRVTESGTGAPVVLIPGLFGSAYGFRHLIPSLAEHGYRAIVIEPLGTGASARPERANYSLAAQADRVAAVLDSLGVESAVVVGHSIGAAIAYRLAYRAPRRVGAIISLEGGPAETAATKSFRRAMRFAPWIKWMGGIKLIRKKIRAGLIESSGDSTWITEDVVQGYTAGAAADLDGTLKAFLGMAAAKEPEKLSRRLRE
ncbi:MAG: alpha/beta hydrolase, partial [Gemmatimonadetes bacterium]|nr:alpha/beta hydrolase [Gemmatimonadota bacterium]